MLQRCSYSFAKHTLSVNRSRPTLVPLAGLRTRHDPSQDAAARPLRKAFESAEPFRSVARNSLRGRSPLIRRALKVAQRRRLLKSQSWTPALGVLFFRLSQLLKRQDVSGAALWSFVDRKIPWQSISSQHRFTEWQKSLLSQVLHRVLDEWASQEITSASIQPFVVLRAYLSHNLIRRGDWIYSLGFLAKIAYQRTNLRQTQPRGAALAGKMADAIHLRVLCKAWRLFLIGDQRNPSNSGKLAHNYKNLWPGLQRRDGQAREVENGDDFAQNFMNGIANQYNLSDPALDRYLACSAVLTLVALYDSLRMVSTDNFDALKEPWGGFSQAAGSASGESDSSTDKPNWHLGPGQGTYWTPAIGLLSVSEASILHRIAHAAKDASLNLTLLRITLAQMSVPEADAQAIARTYQGFQLAVPTILAKFQDFEYDENVSKAGMLRRYPFKAYLSRAIASKDITALDHAGAVAEAFSGVVKIAPGDALGLVKACLQIDLPRRAFLHWNSLVRPGNLGEHAWSIWLDYAVRKGDHVAFETAWSRFDAPGIRRTRKMWRQRLLLLHQSNQSLAAWDHFCTLVRFTGKNRKLVGVHIPRISPSSLHVEMFHLMIRAYLDKAHCQVGVVSKAKDTLELLHKQKGVQVKRDTYMLFVRHFLSVNARQSAVEWYVAGRIMNIKFSLSDYALLFEYDLVAHRQDKRQPLADPFGNIRQSFDAISNTMRLVCGQRLLIWSSPPASPLSSKFELILRERPFVDRVDDNPEDPKMKETQTVYEGLMQHLALNFASRPSCAAKTARLRLLLLLWDHCIITGVPASTGMDSTLRSVVYSLPPELQEKLMRGAMFNNYNVADPDSFHSYRFLRLIGPQWFAERVKSIPSSLAESQLTTIPWNGYGGVNEEALIKAGIVSPEDRRKILAEIMTWESEAIAKRTEAAERKKDLQKQRKIRSQNQKGKADDINRKLRILQARLPRAVQTQEQTLKELSDKLETTRTKNEAERHLVFEELPSVSSSGLIRFAVARKRICTRNQPSSPREGALPPDIRATRKQPLDDTPFENTSRSCDVGMADGDAVVSPGVSVFGRFWRRRRRVAIANGADNQLENVQLRLHGTSATKWVYKGA